MTAVRLARAQTKRSKILIFDGGYHGHSDSLLAGNTTGIPDDVARHTLNVPYNDPGAFEQAIERFGEQLACVVIEPVAANMGVVIPDPGYLAKIRQLTSQRGILLIFDEVVTGFRLARTGAQGAFGITPDLTTFGKIIGGGLPIGALGGPARLMQRLTPEGDVYHGGTFAGHPLSMAAGVAMLRQLAAHPPYARLDATSRQLAEGLAEGAREAGIPMQINRVGSMLTVFFSDHPVRNAAQVRASDRRRFAHWANGLRRHGVLLPPSPFEALFVSTRHTARHVDHVVTTSRNVLKRMAASS